MSAEAVFDGTTGQIYSELIEEKVRSARRHGALRSLELCSGAGGMALGFASQGYDLRAHVESSSEASRTYGENLLGLRAYPTDSRLKPLDMMTFDDAELLERFDITGDFVDAFDVLVAGLPCQAFARVGRSKLRAVAGHTEAFRLDPRASMYKRFLQLIEQAMPLAVVLENVPDILNFGGHNVPEEISRHLEKLGYEARYTLLNSAFYGVPQYRERLFLVAIHKQLGITPDFPLPTHYGEIPKGYLGSRKVALKHITEDSRYVDSTILEDLDLHKVVTAEEAIADLPVLRGHLTGAPRIPLSAELPYRFDASSGSYAAFMRSWMAPRASTRSTGHGIRLTPRDYETFGRMSCGDDYPLALRVAESLLEERLRRDPAKDPASLRKNTVPPYDPAKFPNKWWKLVPSAPVRTLTAHLGKDTYSHIHYDSSQKRMISVREAARLQSFPDWYDFGSSINAGLRQIGNAVPPLLAAAIARSVRDQILGRDGSKVMSTAQL